MSGYNCCKRPNSFSVINNRNNRQTNCLECAFSAIAFKTPELNELILGNILEGSNIVIDRSTVGTITINAVTGTGATTVMGDGSSITVTGPIGGPYTVSADYQSLASAGGTIDLTPAGVTATRNLEFNFGTLLGGNGVTVDTTTANQATFDIDYQALTSNDATVVLTPATGATMTRNIEVDYTKIIGGNAIDVDTGTVGQITIDFTGAATIPSGTIDSQYIRWDNTASAWVIGSTNIALGANAGVTTQGTNSIAIGLNAGQTTQGSSAIFHRSKCWK